MARGQKEEKDIKCNVIKVLKNTPNTKGDGGMWLRVVSWIINGKEYKPSLEKREYYVAERGEMMGKAKGFGPEDFLFILSHISEIAQLMKIDGRFIGEAISAATPVMHQAEEPSDGRETF